MRIAACILGLLAALACIGLPLVWQKDYDEGKALLSASGNFGTMAADLLKDELAAAEKKAASAKFLIPLGVLNLIAAFLVFKFSKPVGALNLLTFVIAIATGGAAGAAAAFFFLFSGIFALMAKPKAAAQPAVAPVPAV